MMKHIKYTRTINSRKALLRKVYCFLTGKKAVSLFLDDTENSMRCLENHDITLGKQYLAEVQTVNQYIAQFCEHPLLSMCYGFKDNLHRWGLPKQATVVDMKYLNASGKNAADIKMALDLAQLPLYVHEVVIGSSDSDMSPIIEHLEQQGIKAHLFSCGQVSRQMKAKNFSCIPLDGLLHQLKASVSPVTYNYHAGGI